MRRIVTLGGSAHDRNRPLIGCAHFAAEADASPILLLVEWYPSKPTLPQAAFGIVFFLAMAGLALHWAADETSTGNRVFLWCVAGLAVVLALWRLVAGIRLAREGSARQR